MLGAFAGVIGAMMALEVVREIVGFGEGLVGRLLMIDALRCTSRRFATPRTRKSAHRRHSAAMTAISTL